MLIPVLIVTYNSRSTIESCLRSIANYATGCPIILIDNNSVDDTVNIINDFHKHHPEIALTLTRNKENIGFARAVNQGIHDITSYLPTGKAGQLPVTSYSDSFCLLLNPDAVLTEDALENLKKEINLNTHIAVVAAKLIDENEMPRRSIGRTPTFLRIIWQTLWRNGPFSWIINNNKEYSLSHDVAWSAATCWLVRLNIWHDLKGFDENFFLYIEDVDFCRRIHNLHRRVRFCANAIIEHAQQGSAGQQIIKSNRWEINGLLYYYQKWNPHNHIRLAILRWVLMARWRLKKLLHK